MAIIHKDSEELTQTESPYYQTQIDRIITQLQPAFDQVIKKHVAFHLFFWGVGCLEVLLLITFFAYFAASFLLASFLGLLFGTAFVYFMLRVHFQEKKSEKLKGIAQEFSRVCQELVRYEEGASEHHLLLSDAYNKWAHDLHNQQKRYFCPPKWLSFLSLQTEALSEFCFFEDVVYFREALLFGSVQEHIQLVRTLPTSLEAHAALANAYVMLSGLYTSSKRGDKWPFNKAFDEEMEKKFRATAKKAIEEFKILNDYAPDDPWVHVQLAYSYHDLNMPEEEMKEYEEILLLRPNDEDILYKLGVLYFQHGYNAKGLRVYETLRRYAYKLADNLIKNYGGA